ncbi:MAG: nuclear transport factor 2 family protein [Flavobacteriales bacterium]|nr:nuclear transport factor 2 family protein [Flavobacteriales bacterium]MCB9168318.1 nuclear transport factor 2 family protein [Flavobacteriales bacterium]
MRSIQAVLSVAILSACTHRPALSTPTPATPNILTSTIAALDSALFAAFNAQDTAALGTWFTPDLEFYHDKSGLADHDGTMAGFQHLFTQPTTADMHRTLVPGTMEVYPLGDFGALEVCQHRFTHTEDGQVVSGVFKNIMIWRKDSTGYRVSRVISYDH